MAILFISIWVWDKGKGIRETYDADLGDLDGEGDAGEDDARLEGEEAEVGAGDGGAEGGGGAGAERVEFLMGFLDLWGMTLADVIGERHCCLMFGYA